MPLIPQKMGVETPLLCSTRFFLEVNNQASRQATDEGSGTGPGACLPARCEEFKGLSLEEAATLREQGVLGSWEDSLPNEKHSALEAICSLAEQGFFMKPEVALNLLTKGVMTAKGAWAMAQTLLRKRFRHGASESICQSPHFNVRNWLAGNFLTVKGAQNALAKDFFSICDSLNEVGWYDRPVSPFTERQRGHLRSLEQNSAKGFPLPEVERREMALAVSKQAKMAREASRQSYRTPEALQDSTGDKILAGALKEALGDWADKQRASINATREAAKARRCATSEELARTAEAVEAANRVTEILLLTGPILLKTGNLVVAEKQNDWAVLFQALGGVL